MNLTRLARTAGLGGAAALLAITAACGSAPGGGDSGSGDSANAAALTKSDIFTKITDAQKKAGSYSFSLKVAAGPLTTSGSGKADVSGAKPAVDATVEVSGQSLETRTVDGLVYLKSSGLKTSKWVKIDPSDKSGPGALFTGSSDPAQQLASLADAAKVTQGKTARVGGVNTKEYVVTVPSAAVAKKNPTLKAAASALPKTMKFDLFVDQDNLLRRFENTISVSGQTISTQVSFSDYGKDVSIEAPPASRTTTKLDFGALGGSAG